jgi:mono/diheme cytochrome c family protein
MRSKSGRLSTAMAMMAMAVVLLSTVNLFAQGGDTFKAKCAMCHGPDGSGKTAMGEKLKLRDLHSPEVQKQTDAELTQIITKGKGKMAPFESKLSKEQIDQVVGYIRDLGKKQ